MLSDIWFGVGPVISSNAGLRVHGIYGSFFTRMKIVSEESSWIFRFASYIVSVTPIFVVLLIPVLTSYPLFFAFMGDMLGGGFALSLGGFFAALAAVDTGNPYGH